MDSPGEGGQGASGADRPYYSKRPHRKSRAGCRNCKTRKVKCDESRPSCRACRLRREACTYSTPASSASPKSETASSRSRRSSTRPRSPTEAAVTVRNPDIIVVKEPAYTPPDKDVTDMKLLWFYTIKTYESFNTNASASQGIDEVLRNQIIQYAFSTPFLMDTILGITAQHMKHLGVPVPRSKAITYRINAFAGYRRAIEAAKPETFPALLAASLLLCAVSTAQFRDDGDGESARPLYILDWIFIWRGIGLIIDLVRPEILYASGMQRLFFRPPMDLNTSALHVPSNLLFMVTSIKDGDEDFPYVGVYYDTLKYLGALYRELLDGFSGILDLRVITWYTFLPKQFIELARQRRPRALVIVAHHLCFAKCLNGPWWMEGIADHEIENLCNLLDSGDESRPPTEWTPVLHVPRAVSRMTDRTEVARVLLDNHDWKPRIRRGSPEDEERSKEIAWVDDTGKPVAFTGEWVYKVPARHKPQFRALEYRVAGADEEVALRKLTAGAAQEYMDVVGGSPPEDSGLNSSWASSPTTSGRQD